MEWKRTDLGVLPVMSWCPDADAKTLGQVAALADHPNAFHHIALMPDAHFGYGMPIGGVAAFDGAVVPYAVGVDIGCGVAAVHLDFPATRLSWTQLERIRKQLERDVPLGFSTHRDVQQWDEFEKFRDECDRPLGWCKNEVWQRALRSLGTLGGGNHFIEIQREDAGDEPDVWLMLHSGSRNLGKCIADYYAGRAKKRAEQDGLPLADPDLAPIPASEQLGRDYLRDMTFALAFAQENRRRMMDVFLQIVRDEIGERAVWEQVNIHHNYAAEEEHFGRRVWVHRKGATSARDGELGIIPGDMATASYIVRGKGNADSFASCSHGAGRCLGRMEANRQLDKDEMDRTMKGISFRGFRQLDRRGRRFRKLHDAGRHWQLDEATAAYKDIDSVIAHESDLVEVVTRLRPLAVVKG
jgi:tRNA-splicing ligase RtcB (3'-phosphate/5'-hydroxy nucleic acid ligase)